MSLHLADELSRAGEQIAREAVDLLSSAADERLHALLSRIPTARDAPWSVVLTGPYNAGKSSIAFALTGDDSIVIDADVATAKTERYPWGGVEVVDTPGVRTGDDTHDEIAETALRDADLVLFVITPNLFDDQIAEYFSHVVNGLGKLEQVIVVVNKSTQVAASDEIREQAVRDVLEPGQSMPLIVACDAKAHLDSQTAEDPDVRQLAARRSNWAGFEETVATFIRAQGATGRLRKPFEAVLAVADDARPFLTTSDGEEAARDLLNRQRQMMAQSRERLAGRFEDVFDRLRQSIANAGEKVVSTARDGIPQGKAVEDFDATVQGLAKSLGEKLQVALGEEMVALEADGHRLAEGPEAIRLTSALLGGSDPIAARRQESSRDALQELLKSFAKGQGKDWLDKLVGGGSRPGAPMHGLVLEIGHRFGKQFKPWEAVKWSKRLNVAVRAATAIFEFGKQVHDAVQEDQKQARLIAELRASVHEVSEGLISTARVDLAPLVASLYADLSAPIDSAQAELDAAEAERDRISSGLGALSRRAREALAGRAVVPASGSDA